MRKAVLQWKRRMEDLFCTFSANQLTDDYCDVFWCGLLTSDDMNDKLLANIVL